MCCTEKKLSCHESHCSVFIDYNNMCIVQFRRIAGVFALATAEDIMNKHGSRAGMSSVKRQTHARNIQEFTGR